MNFISTFSVLDQSYLICSRTLSGLFYDFYHMKFMSSQNPELNLIQPLFAFLTFFFTYLGVLGATGFRVDLKIINPVKTENKAHAHNMRQNLSCTLK